MQEFVKEATDTMMLLDSFSKEFDYSQRVPLVIKHDALHAYDAIINPETVDLVLTSPPYGQRNNRGIRTVFMALKHDSGAR